MHIPELFAWSWTGHGALTSAAVTAAISQFVTLGKSFLEKRFVEIYKVWLAFQLSKPESAGPPRTSAQDCLLEMMAILPSRVQREDIHPANIPVIGEPLNPKTGQVRHFMRSSASVSSLEAYNASKSYIIKHLTDAWSKYREAIKYQDKWYEVITSSSSLFWDGNFELGRALHTIEDSYAPGHVTRVPGSGFIVRVNIWDDENRKPDLSKHWLGHHALDEPAHSQAFYVMAQETTTALIVCVLRNLDQEPHDFTKDLTDSIERYFHLGLAFEK